MCDQLEHDLALAQVSYQQHRNALVNLLKQKNQELTQANRSLTDQLQNVREEHRQQLIEFQESVLARMQALQQSVSRVEGEFVHLSEDQYQTRLDQLTAFIRVQLRAHQNETDRLRKQLDRVKADYDSDLQRLEGLLSEAQLQRDELITSLQIIRKQHSTIMSRDSRSSVNDQPCKHCQQLQERLQQLMGENDKLSDFNDRLVQEIDQLQKQIQIYN